MSHWKAVRSRIKMLFNIVQHPPLQSHSSHPHKARIAKLESAAESLQNPHSPPYDKCAGLKTVEFRGDEGGRKTKNKSRTIQVQHFDWFYLFYLFNFTIAKKEGRKEGSSIYWDQGPKCQKLACWIKSCIALKNMHIEIQKISKLSSEYFACLGSIRDTHGQYKADVFMRVNEAPCCS